ncbi:MAG: hypothetical protein JSR31_05375 [Nitrospira sp.]|nr:hypothetical protein [Nitrospira sp.]
MKATALVIPDVKLIELKVFGDDEAVPLNDTIDWCLTASVVGCGMRKPW